MMIDDAIFACQGTHLSLVKLVNLERRGFKINIIIRLLVYLAKKLVTFYIFISILYLITSHHHFLLLWQQHIFFKKKAREREK